MASVCLSTTPTSKPFLSRLPQPPPTQKHALSFHACWCSLHPATSFSSSLGIEGRGRRRASSVVRVGPQEDKVIRRHPLDFPLEWEKARPPHRPDIFPQFSPMKVPLPPPLPFDPPEEDEFAEEEEEQQEEEGEENPEREGQENAAV